MPAPPLVIHGAPLSVVLALLKFSTAQTTATPFSTDDTEAMPTSSLNKGFGSKPRDSDIMSTPSAMACSMAASMSLSVTFVVELTLYMARYAHNATLLAMPQANPN
ncbi:hypothetical protein SLE2022_170950 [Rubroshorea leprosula]